MTFLLAFVHLCTIIIRESLLRIRHGGSVLFQGFSYLYNCSPVVFIPFPYTAFIVEADQTASKALFSQLCFLLSDLVRHFFSGAVFWCNIISFVTWCIPYLKTLFIRHLQQVVRDAYLD